MELPAASNQEDDRVRAVINRRKSIEKMMMTIFVLFGLACLIADTVVNIDKNQIKE